MGAIRPPQPVKLFIGLIGGDADLLKRARQLLVRRFGPVDLESEVWPFTWTAYYEGEMGSGLLRWFIAFEKPIRPEAIAEIKLDTNRIEEEIAADCEALEITRPVNIDPGYVDLGKIVLATTKDRSHRIYLGMGIFAESTLHFVGGAWETWPWTFPDYRSAEYHAYFITLRERLRQQRSEIEGLLGAPPEPRA